MHAIMLAIIGAILFVLLTPGLILRIPPKASLLTASIVHAVVFGILFYLVTKITYQHYNTENFLGGAYTKYQVVNDDNVCKKQNCNEAIRNNDLISENWWNEGEGCNRCSFVKNNGSENCNVDDCNKSIREHIIKKDENLQSDNLWLPQNKCSGCTKLEELI